MSEARGLQGDAYQRRLDRIAATGASMHGEADFVAAFTPTAVLDAGCGTGRVAIELASRGVDVLGVDADESMIDTARRQAPDLHWIHADLADPDRHWLPTSNRFDVVVAAGNVMIFVVPGSEAAVVSTLASAVTPGGHVVAGFQLGRSLDIESYERCCVDAGLSPIDRFSTWQRAEFDASSDYVVAVSQRPYDGRPCTSS